MGGGERGLKLGGRRISSTRCNRVNRLTVAQCQSVPSELTESSDEMRLAGRSQFAFPALPPDKEPTARVLYSGQPWKSSSSLYSTSQSVMTKTETKAVHLHSSSYSPAAREEAILIHEPQATSHKPQATSHRRRVVGAPGFEPGASCSQSRRATKLRHAPPRGVIVPAAGRLLSGPLFRSKTCRSARSP